jgi:hypothetical protein
VSCLAPALAFLAQLGMAAPPPLVIADVPLSRPGFYSSGVLMVRGGTTDCGVWVHELVHHWQFTQRGPAASLEEWERREEQARRVEVMFRETGA